MDARSYCFTSRDQASIRVIRHNLGTGPRKLLGPLLRPADITDGGRAELGLADPALARPNGQRAGVAASAPGAVHGGPPVREMNPTHTAEADWPNRAAGRELRKGPGYRPRPLCWA